MKFKKEYRVELAKTLSGHWYSVWEKNKNREKFLGHYPSATTILNAFPQTQQLSEWIGKNGWEESQRIKNEAGVRGTRIHAACDMLEDGKILYEKDYSLEEWFKIDTFVKWYKKFKPILIAKELAVFSKKLKCAGRLDRIYLIENQRVVLDFKSSSALHDHFPLQFSFYAQAIEESTHLKIDCTAALLLGAKNKDGYRYVPYEDWKYHLEKFQEVQGTWEYVNFGSKKNPKDPPVLVLPDKLSLHDKPSEAFAIGYTSRASDGPEIEITSSNKPTNDSR